jgi:hypothetical protein
MADDPNIPPISSDMLDRLRFDATRLSKSGNMGAHLRRRHGQSLEFREYREYNIGDDVRHVDWRTSLRHGTKKDLLVKTFEAEEKLTVAVSIDPRSSMYLPEDHGTGSPGFQRGSKMQVACWLLLVLAELTTMERDPFLIHRLFHEKGAPGEDVQTGGIKTARQVVADLVSTSPRGESDWGRLYEVNDEPLLQALPPASVLIVLSDFYAIDGRFIEMLHLAQGSYREVILIALDSWPVEAARLGSRPLSRISGLEGIIFPDPLTQIDDGFLRSTENNLNLHLDELRTEGQAGGLYMDRWPWPAVAEGHTRLLRASFQERLMACQGLATVFVRNV